MTEQQRKDIEAQYKDFAEMGEHGYCNGMEYTLTALGEADFVKHLNETYRS